MLREGRFWFMVSGFIVILAIISVLWSLGASKSTLQIASNLMTLGWLAILTAVIVWERTRRG